MLYFHLSSYSISMLPKYVKKLLQQLTIDPAKTANLQTSLAKIEKAQGRNLVRYTGGVCKALLKISEQLGPEEEEQMDTILYILQQLFQRIRNEDIYEIQLIKIKMFLVGLNHQNTAKGQREEERKRKVLLFLQRLESNVYYPLLQEDFYSQLESIYLQASKCLTKQGNIQEAEISIKKCFTTLKRQSAMLAELGKSDQDKYGRVIESKGKALEQLFYLEYANRIHSGELSETEVVSSLTNRYEALYTRMGMRLNSQHLISNANKILGNVESQIEEDSELEVKDRQKSLTINRDSSLRSSYISLKRQSRIEIEDTVNFIQNMQTRRVSGRTLSRRSFGRLSLKVTEPINNLRSTVRHSTADCQRTTSKAKTGKFTIKEMSENGKSEASKRTLTCLSQPQKKKRALSGAKTIKKFDMVLRKEKQNREKLVLFNPFNDKQFKNADVTLKASQSRMISQGFITLGAMS